MAYVCFTVSVGEQKQLSTTPLGAFGKSQIRKDSEKRAKFFKEKPEKQLVSIALERIVDDRAYQ